MQRDPRITQPPAQVATGGVSPPQRSERDEYIEIRYPDGDVIYVDFFMAEQLLFDLYERRLVQAFTVEEIQRAKAEGVL